jgi:hypothetical protein
LDLQGWQGVGKRPRLRVYSKEIMMISAFPCTFAYIPLLLTCTNGGTEAGGNHQDECFGFGGYAHDDREDLFFVFS